MLKKIKKIIKKTSSNQSVVETVKVKWCVSKVPQYGNHRHECRGKIIENVSQTELFFSFEITTIGRLWADFPLRFLNHSIYIYK